ncbi:hypothetical protein BU26DRAFT_519097 [Trematosphaeria pertusa]|uniref:Phosphatidylglycerol/phosphatidylinositol transfer protein n=1 Tax=Trematosphaeria pertusa TaxID=390896 RepID=A0A6A6IFD3_9PLEO|nr:uncharacterized protein BU26DRAFT_519097 [Trematosphaeria pertusa]KAF2248899.1 hypothetical protein BU26DRAFT_519097 [Trematosphaeria pertusa]
MHSIATALLLTAVAAGSVIPARPHQQQQPILGNTNNAHDDQIPGNASFMHCKTAEIRDNNIFHISRLDAYPSPSDILPGDTITLTLTGRFTDGVPRRSLVATFHTFGGDGSDICDSVTPVVEQEGEVVLQMKDRIPWGTPVGHYALGHLAATPRWNDTFCVVGEIFVGGELDGSP